MPFKHPPRGFRNVSPIIIGNVISLFRITYLMLIPIQYRKAIASKES